MFLINSVTSLKCYRCNERSKTACEEKQTVEDCSNQFRNPICLTVTYSEKLNNGEKLVHPVVKKCSTVTSRGCDGHCSRFWMDCKVSCDDLIFLRKLDHSEEFPYCSNKYFSAMVNVHHICINHLEGITFLDPALLSLIIFIKIFASI